MNPASPERPGTVLVVDDAVENLDLLRSILSRDYRVKAARDGERALRIAASDDPPDLVLLDVVMPGLDGFEVCRRLKADPATQALPVIFVTAKGEMEDEAQGFEAGGVDYITKPVRAPIVLARVRTHLELRRAREDLERQNEILRENVRLREEVETISRHDLKNPLNAVLSVPALLLRSERLEERERDLLRMIEKAGYRMLEMINRSLDLLRMEKGTYELRPEEVDVVAVVEQILREIGDLAVARSIAVETEVEGRPAGEGGTFAVQGEEMLVYSLLANLVRNAVEASPDGGRVTVALAAGGGRARLSVHNAGVIPAPVRGRFFEKFATAGKEEGTGMGTYTARLIAQTLGGSISFRTSEEEGTTLEVVLPR